ncbi:MAG: isopentenyl phosphate kinase [Candidatus Saliniplasma sp.]
MILIKLGGSVISDKNTPYTFKPRITKRLIKEISSSMDEEIIIVHGGGSFGHPGAEKFELNTKHPKSIKEATSKVQKDMRILNTRVIEMMIEEDLWAVSLPGGILTRYSNGKLIDMNTDIFLRYLDIGVVPVTFGDVALDENRGVTICSGDDLMLALGENADRAIFVTNVDGIYKNGNIVEEFTEDMFPLSQEDIPLESTSIDVTGGMNSKVEKMLELSKECRTLLVNGAEEGRLERLIKGKDTVYTEVKT